MRNVDTLVLRSTLTDSHWRSPRWVVGEPVALNALTMSAINQNCQSKLHSSLDVQLCIRRIHHWHLDNIFWCIALTQTWQRKISMIPAVLDLQSFVIRFVILWCGSDEKGCLECYDEFARSFIVIKECDFISNDSDFVYFYIFGRY